MRLLLVGHDRKSAVEQIMLTLFPNEHPQYIEDISELGDYGARVSLNEGKKYITAVTIFIEESKRFMGVARVLISSFGSGELERKRAQNNIIKRSFYKAVMETGKFNPSWGMLTGIRPSKITCPIGQFIFRDIHTNRLY